MTDPLKHHVRLLDAVIVAKGGRSIFGETLTPIDPDPDLGWIITARGAKVARTRSVLEGE